MVRTKCQQKNNTCLPQNLNTHTKHFDTHTCMGTKRSNSYYYLIFWYFIELNIENFEFNT